MTGSLEHSRALWNRERLDLRSQEILAQILDRGSLDEWRELYALAGEDAALLGRIAQVVQSVPLAFGHFWVAALRSLGHSIDPSAALPTAE